MYGVFYSAKRAGANSYTGEACFNVLVLINVREEVQ